MDEGSKKPGGFLRLTNHLSMEYCCREDLAHVSASVKDSQHARTTSQMRDMHFYEDFAVVRRETK